MFVFFENEQPAALADHGAASLRVERPARGGGCIVRVGAEMFEQALSISGLEAESIQRLYRSLGQIALNQNRIDDAISYFDE